MVIADLSPEPGHPAVYHHSAECCQPIDEDYGLIIFSRGLTPERVCFLHVRDYHYGNTSGCGICATRILSRRCSIDSLRTIVNMSRF